MLHSSKDTHGIKLGCDKKSYCNKKKTFHKAHILQQPYRNTQKKECSYSMRYISVCHLAMQSPLVIQFIGHLQYNAGLLMGRLLCFRRTLASQRFSSRELRGRLIYLNQKQQLLILILQDVTLKIFFISKSKPPPGLEFPGYCLTHFRNIFNRFMCTRHTCS